LLPSFRPDQLEAMNSALKKVLGKLPGPNPVIELVAVRILELARDGEFDPDKLTEIVLAEFDLQPRAPRRPAVHAERL
jgi:hypothetical protein